MKSLAILRAAIMGLVMTLAVPWAALADDVDTDADQAIAMVQRFSQRAAGPGDPFSFTIGLSVLQQGQSTTFPVPLSISTAGGASGWVGSVTPSVVSVPSYGTYVPMVLSGTVPLGTPSGTYRINVTPANASWPNLGNGNPVHLDIVVSAPDATPPAVSPIVAGALGDDGWYTGDVTVSWTVTDLDGPITSVTGCDTSSVTADTTGETFTCTATSAGGTTSVSVTIRRDAGLPTIEGAASPAPNENGWNNSPVTIAFACADVTSGIASCGPDVTLDTDGTGLGATGTARDAAGNTSSATVSGIDLDMTPPSVSVSAANADATPYTTGWTDQDVTVTFICTDALSGCSFIEDEQTVTDEGTTTVTSAAFSDLAGNAASETFSVSIDKTAPVISAVASGTLGNNGWYVTQVSVDYACSDALSGIASCPSPTVLGDGAGQTASGTAVDNAGNTQSAGVSGINVDTTPPAMTVDGDAGTFALGDGPDATCADSGSGMSGTAAWSTPSGGDVNGFGTLTTTVSCSDNAGNVTTQAVTYTVTLAKSLTCFLSPIKADGTYSAKQGSSIPMKCQLTAVLPHPELVTLSVRVTDPSAQQIAAIDAGSANANGTVMRYTSGLPGYIFNWQTSETNARHAKPLPLGRYAFTVTVDSITFQALVTLTK